MNKLDELLNKGFLVAREKEHDIAGKKHNIELHLARSFQQVKPMCSSKDEL